MTDQREEWGPLLPHDGGTCPVPFETAVLPLFRAAPVGRQVNPYDNGCLAMNLAWYHDGNNDDVVGYRVRKCPDMLSDIVRGVEVDA